MRSADPKIAVSTTVVLVVAGTGLGFGTSFLVGSLFPGSPQDVRATLGSIALALPLVIALRADVALFGFRRERLGIAVSSGITLALVALLGFGKGSALSSGPSADRFVALLALIVVASVEEGIFRGVLQAQLIEWLGRWRGLFAGVACFSVWHIPQRLSTGLGGVDLAVSLAPVAAVGTVLALFMLIVRNASGPAILHTAVNWMDRL